MVDEARLERRGDLDEPLDRQMELGLLRGQGMEGLLDQLTGESGKGERTRARREDEDVAGVEPLAASTFVEGGVEVDVQGSVLVLHLWIMHSSARIQYE